MKAKDVEIGGRYLAKVGGKLTTVRVDDIRANWEGKTRYDVTNMRTGRKTTFRSASKFRAKFARDGQLI